MGSADLWRVMSASWSRKCLDEPTAKPIMDAISDALNSVIPKLTLRDGKPTAPFPLASHKQAVRD